MNVKITLYSTKFDNENVFVGESESDRLAKLETLPKKVIERCPFNPLTPFKVQGNFSEFLNKYNYCKYDFYIDDTSDNIIMTNCYNIQSFAYVNDYTTEIICNEDLLAKHYHSIMSSGIVSFPKRYTWKRSERGVDFVKENCGSLYENVKTVNLRNSNTLKINDYFTRVGFLILTFVGNYSSYKDYYYVEDGIEFPIITTALPFYYYDEGDGKVAINFSNCLFYLEEEKEANRMDGLSHFRTLCNQPEQGFKLISQNIFLETELLGYFEKSTDNNNIIFKPIGGEYATHTILGAGGNYLFFKKGYTGSKFLYQFKTTDDTALEDFNNNIFYEERILETYCKMTVRKDGQEYPINPNVFNKKRDNTIRISKSFLPPYNLQVSISDIKFENKQTFDINSNSTFINFEDSYIEFMRSNYNSQILGFEYSQDRASQDRLRNAIFNMFKLGANSIQTGEDTKGSDIASSAKNVGIGLISEGQSIWNFTRNQEKERQMHEFQLKDIENIPNSFSSEGSLLHYIKAKNDVHFFLDFPHRFTSANHLHYMYGYEKMTGRLNFTSLRRHEHFDYFRDGAVVIKHGGLTENERVTLQNIFANGVRLWWKLDDFKNFSHNNNEEV